MVLTACNLYLFSAHCAKYISWILPYDPYSMQRMKSVLITIWQMNKLSQQDLHTINFLIIASK